MTELIHIADGMDWDDFALRQIPVMIGLILGALIPVLWRWAWGATRWTARTAWGIPRKAWRLCASAVQRVNNFVFRREAKAKPESGYAVRRRRQEMAKYRPTSVTAKDAAKSMEAFGRAFSRMNQIDTPVYQDGGGEPAPMIETPAKQREERESSGVTHPPIAESLRAFTRAVRRSTQSMSVAIHYPVGEDAPDNIKIAEGIPDRLGKADGVAVPNTFSFDAINANRKALGLSTNPGEPSTMKKIVAVIEEDGYQVVDISEKRSSKHGVLYITVKTELSDG